MSSFQMSPKTRSDHVLKDWLKKKPWFKWHKRYPSICISSWDVSYKCYLNTKYKLNNTIDK